MTFRHLLGHRLLAISTPFLSIVFATVSEVVAYLVGRISNQQLSRQRGTVYTVYTHIARAARRHARNPISCAARAAYKARNTGISKVWNRHTLTSALRPDAVSNPSRGSPSPPDSDQYRISVEYLKPLGSLPGGDHSNIALIIKL